MTIIHYLHAKLTYKNTMVSKIHKKNFKKNYAGQKDVGLLVNVLKMHYSRLYLYCKNILKHIFNTFNRSCIFFSNETAF